MDMQFFHEFPNLASDVPPDTYTPMRTIAPKFGIPDQEDGEKRVHPEVQQRRATVHGHSVQRFVNHHGQSIIYEPVRQSFQPVMWNAEEFYG
jgi:hypothetical protein